MVSILTHPLGYINIYCDKIDYMGHQCQLPEIILNLSEHPSNLQTLFNARNLSFLHRTRIFRRHNVSSMHGFACAKHILAKKALANIRLYLCKCKRAHIVTPSCSPLWELLDWATTLRSGFARTFHSVYFG